PAYRREHRSAPTPRSSDLIGATGATGAQGLTFLGNWSSSVAYAMNDAVDYLGATYISLQANNAGNQPNSSAAWSLLAKAGDTGADRKSTRLNSSHTRGSSA